MEYFVGALVSGAVAWIAVSLWERRYDTGERTDKGFKLCYWKLSYRRRFLRTIWMSPICVAMILWFYHESQSFFWTCIAAVVLVSLVLGQAVSNYRKWKSET